MPQMLSFRSAFLPADFSVAVTSVMTPLSASIADQQNVLQYMTAFGALPGAGVWVLQLKLGSKHLSSISLHHAIHYIPTI